MTTSRTASRTAATARTEVLGQLKEDHKRVKKAYREFQKLDIEEDAEACAVLVKQVLDELTVHATLEEELLYPAAHGAVADEDLVDEAEVEHETVHALIEQLRGMAPQDEKFSARFTVLCEYVQHHVKEEEGELFPQLEKVRLDWPALATEMSARRLELTPASQEAEDADDADDAEDGARQGQRDAAGASADETEQDDAPSARKPRAPAKTSSSSRRASRA